jgi:phosphoglycerate dehydrogenase-like enzyme
MRPRRYQLTKQAAAIIGRGHPWIFRDQLSSAAHVFRDGDWLSLVDGANRVVAHGIFEAAGAIAIRVLRRGPERPDAAWLRGRLTAALARRAPLAARALRDRQIGVPLGFELAGKTLGVIGMGRSGSALAQRALALGMDVIALHRGAPDRAAFFAACHAVSVHCPLTPETRGLLDAAAFAALRPGAIVVNCARGGVIDRAALADALASGRLGGVGLDVQWDEPADPADPLYADPRVIATPHVAGSTEESFGRITDVVIDNLERLARGEPLRCRVA